MSDGREARHSAVTAEHGSPLTIAALAREVMGAIDFDPASSAAWNANVGATTYYSKADALVGAGEPRFDPATRSTFAKPWRGRGFLNPPGGHCDRHGYEVIPRNGGAPACTETGACGLPPGHAHDGYESGQKLWWFQLAAHWAYGEVTEAVFVCFSVELLQSSQVDPPRWSRGALVDADAVFSLPIPIPLDFPICYPRGRLRYLRPDGSVGASPPHSSCIVYLPPKDGSRDGSVQQFMTAFGALGRVVVPA